MANITSRNICKMMHSSTRLRSHVATLHFQKSFCCCQFLVIQNSSNLSKSHKNTRISYGTSRHLQKQDESNKSRSAETSITKRIAAYFSLLGGIIPAVAFYLSKRRSAREEKNVYEDPDFGRAGRMVFMVDPREPEQSFLIPEFARKVRADINNFAVRDTDIFVASFPKSGTTWVQYIVQLLKYEAYLSECEANEASGGSPGKGSATPSVRPPWEGGLESDFPYLEYVHPGLDTVRKMDSPRHIKTHLPWPLLPWQLREGKGKVIYIARNPKDVSVSYFHFARMLAELKYSGDFPNFYAKFSCGAVAYGPWPQHVTSFWRRRIARNVHFMTYEALHADPVVEIQKLAAFLGVRVTRAACWRVARHASFTQMARNPATNYEWWDEYGLRKPDEAKFFRKGRVGDWTNYYSPEMVAQIETTCCQPLKEEGLVLPDKL